MKDNPQKAQAAKCPFYRRCTDASGLFAIHCEGLSPDGGLKVWFATPAERDRHFDVFCGESYKHCELHKAIMEAQYADDIEGD